MIAFVRDFFRKEKAQTKETVDHDIDILRAFINVYCREHHSPVEGERCEECESLLNYAIDRRAQCPYDPKPACKHCETHCYRKSQRDKIREVMKFSGKYFIKRGRVDWLIKYFLT